MIICSACRQEIPKAAHFCGYCGFRLTPIPHRDLEALSEELLPIEVDSPMMLTEVKKVKGKGAQILENLKANEGEAPPEPVVEGKVTAGPKVVGKWEEPPVRVFPDTDESKAKATSPGRAQREHGITGGGPPPQPSTSQVDPGKATASGRALTGKMQQVDQPEDAPKLPLDDMAQVEIISPERPPLPTADELAPVETTPPPRAPTPVPAEPPVRVPEPPPVEPPVRAAIPPPTLGEPPVRSITPPPASGAAMSSKEGRDARRYRRFPLKVEVGYATDHNFYTGFMENLSSGGLFIATHQPGRIGEVMEVAFTVPGIPGQCLAICQVTWTRDYDDSNEDMIPGMGLKFIQLDPKVRATVEMFIKHREPIFFDD